MSNTSLPDLSAQAAYGSFYVPHFEIRIGGAALPNNVIRDVMQITYKDNVKEIDSVDLTVNNWDEANRRCLYIGSETSRDLPGGAEPDPLAVLFEPGVQTIEIWLGYVGVLRLVTTVNITSMEPSFTSGGPPALQVRGLNVLHQLRRGQRSYAWTDAKPSEIARSLPTLSHDKKTRLPLPVEVDDAALKAEAKIAYLAQDNQHDVDFLLGLARRMAYDLVVVERTQTMPRHLRFAPSKTAVRPTDYRLTWGQTLIDFKPRLTTTRQIRKATVKGWDRRRKQPINVTVDLTDREVQRVNKDLQRLVDTADDREEIVVNEPVFTEQQARDRARSILLDKIKEMVTADGTTIGLPDLRAGSKLLIDGVGARLGGQYFVTETTHGFSDTGYTTRFKARREGPEVGA